MHVPLKLMYHFYISEDWKDSYTNKIHFNCLRHYADLFDSAVICLSVDDVDDKKTILEVEERFLSLGLPSAIQFIIHKNDRFREAAFFHNEIAAKLESHDELVFFGHNKGLTNLALFPKRNVEMWVTALYYGCLNFIDEAKEALTEWRYLAYGGLLDKVTSPDAMHRKDLGKRKYFYTGTFFIMNCKTIAEYLKNSNEGLPLLCDRWYAENFFANCFDFEFCYCHKHRYAVDYIMGGFDVEKLIKATLWDDDLEDFYRFNDRIVKCSEGGDISYLTALANYYHTDKGTEYGDKHGFTEIYDDYFSKLKSPRILEVGVWECFAERAFNDYFKGDCEIYALDINDTKEKAESIGKNVHFIQMDQSNKESVLRAYEELKGMEFDVIIDDGSHVWYDQMITMSIFNKLLKKDGIYILEDLQFSLPYTDRDYSPLSCLALMKDSVQLTDEENAAIFSHIGNLTIYSKKNVSTERMVDEFKGRSITCIINFEKE